VAERPSALSHMSSDYAHNARSQALAFAHTYPTVLAAAKAHNDVRDLVVADLGAADGVNSHELITALVAERDGRGLHYALVDLPSNVWQVAARELVQMADRSGYPERFAVIPDAATTRDFVRDVGTGDHLGTADEHLRALREASARQPAPATVVSLAGIPIQTGPCLPPGTVHIAVSGTAMHWVSDSGALPSTGSVFPGYPNHRDAAQREAWADAAARDWTRILEHRGAELAPGGTLVAAIPASPGRWPDRGGAYRAISADMDDILASWREQGRIGPAALAAVVVPTWSRTLEEFRAPFGDLGGTFAGLTLEVAELFTLDNPYRDKDPQVFAENYIRSVEAWGKPLFARALAVEGAGECADLLRDLHDELVSRVARDPERHRRDYQQALIVCRKTD
jgi:SAM-dependent methyltransferase